MEHTNYNLNLSYCRASSAKRLANYLIDLIVFYIILFFIGFATEALFPGSISGMNINSITERLIAIVLYGLVMFITEAIFQGKSVGKLITGTKAVNINGDELTFDQYLIRNFTRAIPFNSISALGTPCTPWHDQWSKTIVVDVKFLDLELRKEEFFTELKNQRQ